MSLARTRWPTSKAGRRRWCAANRGRTARRRSPRWVGRRRAGRIRGRRRKRGIFDVFAAQVAGPGVDLAGGEDGALDEHQFGGVEPAAEVALIEVGGSVQAFLRMPEGVHIPTGHPGGQDRQRGGPALPGLREDRLIGPGRARGAPSRGAPMSAMPSMTRLLKWPHNGPAIRILCARGLPAAVDARRMAGRDDPPGPVGIRSWVRRSPRCGRAGGRCRSTTLRDR